MKITPVILSGGSGTRLWPLSRSSNPKQFLTLFDAKSLFCKTLERVTNNKIFNPPIIVCNEEHRFLVAEELRKLNIIAGSIILEPLAKNTAPAIAVAAFDILKKQESDGDLMLVMPSDHLIENKKQFIQHVKQGIEIAKKNKLITFGIMPDKPETGYGYIEQEKEIEKNSNIFSVKRFVEKPDKLTAKKFLQKKTYLWNSGIFLFKATTYLEALNKLQKNTFSACQKSYKNSYKNSGFIFLEKNHFKKSDNNSIDYAIMENSDNIAVISMNVGWNDVGSWDKIGEISKKDQNNNSLIGNVFSINTKNCYINSNAGLVATIGVENLIIVNLKDATLVINKNNAQDVKKLFNLLEEKSRNECKTHSKVLRPWGSFEVIDVEDRFKVKRIIVNPHSSLSLQMHHKRSEHWSVVKGKATITCADKEFTLNTDQSTYIPIKTKHRLANNENAPLEIIEIQIGDYLEEDDIVRFEDNYGR
jgi:mannose-1-phosphate guanylyltransferase/mannose-6-phosphate isomerase